MKNTYIIAEVGPNHNGSFEMASNYVDVLSEIGVDAIKFQLVNPDLLFSENAIFAEYQKNKNSYNSPKNMAKSHQLSHEDHIKIYKKCLEKNIDYLCTPFDLSSLKFLNENFDLKFFKIASGEIFSVDMLEYISNNSKPIILSTGMATFEEIEKTIEILNLNTKKEIIILHCISNYPTKIENVNLNVMKKLQKIFNYPIGFSDHTEDIFSSMIAVSMGAVVIEKHVTFDKNLDGPDHKASSTIEEFEELIKQIRKIEIVRGSEDNKISNEEKEIANVARKSIVANNNIDKDQIISEENICYKRPGFGILPIYKDQVIGKKAKKMILKNYIIKFEDLY